MEAFTGLTDPAQPRPGLPQPSPQPRTPFQSPQGSLHPAHSPGPHFIPPRAPSTLPMAEDPISAPRAVSPCPSDAAAGLVSSSPQPCPAQPWAPLSWTQPQACVPAHPQPVPREVSDVRGWGCPCCPPAALLPGEEQPGRASPPGPCPSAFWFGEPPWLSVPDPKELLALMTP